MTLVLVQIVIMIMQVLPILYLLWWGYSNDKLSEYYIWGKLRWSKAAFKGPQRHNAFLIKQIDPVTCASRRPSLETRLVGSAESVNQVHRELKEVHDIILT